MFSRTTKSGEYCPYSSFNFYHDCGFNWYYSSAPCCQPHVSPCKSAKLLDFRNFKTISCYLNETIEVKSTAGNFKCSYLYHFSRPGSNYDCIVHHLCPLPQFENELTTTPDDWRHRICSRAGEHSIPRYSHSNCHSDHSHSGYCL